MIVACQLIDVQGATSVVQDATTNDKVLVAAMYTTTLNCRSRDVE